MAHQPSKTVEARLPQQTSSQPQTPPPGLATEEDAAAGGAAAGASSFSFARTLQSELSVSACFDAIVSVHESTRLFVDFSMSDLQLLAQLLTVLKFSAGESIIETGEASSFVGIVLAGTLEVRVPGPRAEPIPVAAGSLLGEMSFGVKNGVRTAEVRATSAVSLAILTFTEIQSLQHNLPEIRLKLMNLFLLHGMQKMRQALDQQQAPVSSRKSLLGDVPDASPPPEARRLPSASVPGSRSGSPVLGSVKGERLDKPSNKRLNTNSTTNRRTTMQTFGSTNLFGNALRADAAAAVPSASPAVTSVNSGGTRVEAMLRKRGVQRIESLSTATAADTDALQKAQKHRLLTIQLVVTGQERQLLVKNQQIDSLTQDLSRNAGERKDLAATIAKRDASLVKIKSERDELTKELAELKQQCSLLETVRSVLEAQVSGSIVDATATHARALEAARAATTDEETRRVEAEKELKATRDALQSLTAEFATHKATAAVDLAHLTNETTGQSARIAELESVNETFRARHTESAAALQTLATTHRLAGQQLEDIEASKQQAHRLFRSTAERLVFATKDLRSYKRVLRRVLISVFVHNCRKKQRMSALHLEVKAMHTELRGEAAKAPSPDEVKVEADDATAWDEIPSPRSSSLKKKKPARLDMMTLITSAHDLLVKVRPMASEMCKAKAHWHESSNAFFERSIELKQQTVELTDSLATERTQHATTRKQLDQLQLDRTAQLETSVAAHHPHRKKQSRSNSTSFMPRGGVAHRRYPSTISGSYKSPLRTAAPNDAAGANQTETANQSRQSTAEPRPRSTSLSASGSPIGDGRHARTNTVDSDSFTDASEPQRLRDQLQTAMDHLQNSIAEGDDSAETPHVAPTPARDDLQFPPLDTESNESIAPAESAAASNAASPRHTLHAGPPSTAAVISTPLSPRQQRKVAPSTVTTPLKRTPRAPTTAKPTTTEVEAKTNESTPPAASVSARRASSTSSQGRAPSRPSPFRTVASPPTNGSTSARSPRVHLPAIDSKRGSRGREQPVSLTEREPKQLHAESSKRSLSSGPQQPDANSMNRTYSQVALHSASPFVASHRVHGVTSSAQDIYSQPNRRRRRDTVPTASSTCSTSITSSPTRKKTTAEATSPPKESRSISTIHTPSPPTGAATPVAQGNSEAVTQQPASSSTIESTEQASAAPAESTPQETAAHTEASTEALAAPAEALPTTQPAESQPQASTAITA